MAGKKTCAQIIAKSLAKAFDDEFVRSKLNREQQLVCVTVEEISYGLGKAYINVSDKELNKEKGRRYNTQDWPSPEFMDNQGVFRKAGEIYLQKAYELVSRDRAHAKLIRYDKAGGVLVYWAPRRMAKIYETKPKTAALDHIRNKVLEFSNNKAQFMTSNQAFTKAYEERPTVEREKVASGGKLDPTKKYQLYPEALQMSPMLGMGKEIQGLHRGGTVVGAARASMMLQKLQQVTGRSQEFGTKSQLKSVKQLLGLGEGIGIAFGLELNKGKVTLNTKSLVGLSVGHVELNAEELDFANLEKLLLDVVTDANRKGWLTEVFDCSGFSGELTKQEEDALTDKLASQLRKGTANSVEVIKGAPPKGMKVDASTILKGQKNKCPPNSVPKLKIPKAAATKKGSKKPQRNKVTAEMLKKDSLLEASIEKMLPGVMRRNMTYPALRWQSGVFGGGIKVQVGRTPKLGILTVSYAYQKDPYKLYDLDMGVRVFDPKIQTQARRPRPLIEKSIREILISKGYKDGEYHLNRLALF